MRKAGAGFRTNRRGICPLFLNLASESVVKIPKKLNVLSVLVRLWRHLLEYIISCHASLKVTRASYYKTYLLLASNEKVTYILRCF